MNATVAEKFSECRYCSVDRPGISLVLPAYNEEAVIVQAVTEAVAALSALTDDFEVLVVDDGCTDRTAELVTAASQQHPQVRLVRQPRNLGYGAALRRGFQEATKELVGFTDSDCQFDLTELSRLVMLAKDYDIVSGYRIDRQDPWLRKLYSAGYNVLVRNLLGTRLRDCDCALKLFHRRVLPQLKITTDGFLVNGEMLAQARQLDYSIVEVGVSHRPRAGGISKVSITHIPVVFAALLRFWWNKVMFPASDATPNTTAPQWSAGRAVGMASLLAVVAGVLFFANLNYSLIEPDECRYAQIALEMYETGDWIVPRLEGEPYLDKPPLLYWSTAACYHLLGPNERSARLPCAVSAWLTVMVVFLLGRKLIGDRAAWLGGALLALSGGFVLSGRFLLMDGPLTLCTTVALLAALRAVYAVQRNTMWWVVAGAACGLGILVKGPVAGVICLPPVFAIAWLSRRSLQVFRLRNTLAFAVPLLLIAVPWFWMIVNSQPDFLEYFFWRHHFQRFVSAFDHSQPWWFFLPVVAVGMLPGSLLAPALAVYLGRKRLEDALKRTPQLGALLLAGVWVVGFFSLSSCKLPTYILPAFPCFALVLGKLLSDMNWQRQPTLPATEALLQHYLDRAARYTMFLTAVLISVGAVIVVTLDRLTLGWGLVSMAATSAILTALGRGILQSLARLATSAAIVSVVGLLLGYGLFVPEVASWRSIAHTAAQLQQQQGLGSPVVFWGHAAPAAGFDIPGRIVELTGEQTVELERLLEREERVVLVANQAELEKLKGSCRLTVHIAGPEARQRVYIATRVTNVARHSH